MANTLFASVYNRFLGKITDDMYMELTPFDTVRDLQKLLIDAIPGFEFPRKRLDYTILIESYGATSNGFAVGTAENGYQDVSYFHCELDSEEINILAILMMNAWLQRQVTTIENIRMKYSGTDFKMTSQANHLAKLLNLLAETQRQSHHMQRLYKRRRTDENGFIRSNWSIFSEDSAITGMKSSTVKTDVEEWPNREETMVYEGGTITDNMKPPTNVIIYEGGEIV